MGPNVLNGNGVAPVDLASCSDAVWPLFAVAGCSRKSKEDLKARGVIRRASTSLEQDLLEQQEVDATADDSNAGAPASSGARGVLPEYSRPGSAYVVTAHHPPRPGSAA